MTTIQDLIDWKEQLLLDDIHNELSKDIVKLELLDAIISDLRKHLESNPKDWKVISKVLDIIQSHVPK